MNDDLPQVSVSPARKAFLSGASFIWILPILALLVALYVAWQNYNDRGPTITIEFENGAGISAGQTEVRYRDVTVGVVEKVGFTQGLGKVTATVRVDKDVAPFIDNTAVFWIVQPEVTAQGITGLSTVLSGVYIEGSWDDEIGSYTNRFQGASQPPLIRPGQSGLGIALRTTANGQLTDNAPILYRGIEVGRVGRAKINPNNNTAVAEALIFDEHRGLINETTRFWDASGFTVSIGPTGAEIDFSSLATLVGGGITFDTFVSGGAPASDGMVFDIFPDKERARNSVFNASEVDPLKVSVIFEENISGLAVGAPVELSGLKIGEVENISGVVDYNQFGDSRVRLKANLSIQPARLGLPVEVNRENALNFLEERVSNGLRARLASASLLTGGLKVELVMVDDADLARITDIETGFPVLPTTENEMTDTAATVEGVFTRINNLPIEELLNSAIHLMQSAEALVTNEDLRETPQDVRELLAEITGLVSSDDVRNIPVFLGATLQRLEQMVADLQREQLTTRLLAAIDAATVTAESVSTSVEGVPALIEDLQAVAGKAEALEVEELIAQVGALVEAGETLVTSEATTALPVELRTAIGQINETIAELREGGLVPGINQTVDNARRATDTFANITAELPQLVERVNRVLEDAASATSNIDTAVAGVPELVEQIQRVAAKAEALDVETLLTELTQVADSADALLTSESVNAVPRELQQALNQVNLVIQDLREGGAVENVNSTLGAARMAADNLAQTTSELPQITERVNRVLEDAASATANIDSAVAGVPELVDQIQRVAAKAEALDVETLLTELTQVADSADALLTSESVNAVPRELQQALNQVNVAIQDLRQGGAIENVNNTLGSARVAADNLATTSAELPQLVERVNGVLDDAAAATANIDTAMEGVPAVVDQIQRVAAKAESLEVEELLAELTDLAESADALLEQEDVAAVPGALRSALDEVNLALQELREGGVVDNVNSTLASARNAADTVAVSVNEIPTIIDRLNRLFAQAGRTIEGYNRGEELNRSVQETLRDIQKAADALASLARTIERNPNSLLLGR